MEKFRFIIVGSGWRSLYYVRIAKALPRHFELCAMLCRTQEKADKMAAENGIYATTSVEECVEMKPDFVVIVVNKASIADVSREWMARGFTVLCETPASLELGTLKELWALKEQGGKLSVAEQYTKYPIYQALLKILDRGLIGAPYAAVVSLAHEYHGACLIRAFLGEGMTPFQVTGKTYSFPTVETLSRYEQFTDGRIADKKRTAAVFEFADGKVAFYDFDSEQYRSPIRNNYLNVRGVRGELRDESFFYLDDQNLPAGGTLVVSRKEITIPEEKNPNLSRVEEITGITYQGEDVYTPPFGLCGLPSDETAIAQIMMDTGAYARGEKELDYSLANALQDSYMAILLQQAVTTGQTIKSEEQPWHKR